MSYNKVVLLGRIGKDSELRYTPNGKPVLEFSLATDSGWGENKVTDWHNCKLFGERTEKLVQFLTKGQTILAEGRISYRQWDGNDGQKHYRTEILVDNVTLTGSRPDSVWPSKSAPAKAAPAAPKRKATADDDDLPF